MKLIRKLDGQLRKYTQRRGLVVAFRAFSAARCVPPPRVSTTFPSYPSLATRLYNHRRRRVRRYLTITGNGTVTPRVVAFGDDV